jgi:hypothetical protein
MAMANPTAWADDDRSYGLDVLEPMYRGIAERADLLVSVASAAATGPTPVFVHCAGGKDRTLGSHAVAGDRDLLPTGGPIPRVQDDRPYSRARRTAWRCPVLPL